MDTDWIEYKCKSGETLFIYNKVTGEHKWPTGDCSTGESCTVMIGQPIIYKELHTAGTQTDDNGCDNGCTSKYINTCNAINSTEKSLLQEPVVLDEARDDLDIEPGLDKEFDDGEERRIEIFGTMIKEEDVNSLNGDSGEATDEFVNIKESNINMDNALANETETLPQMPVVFSGDNDGLDYKGSNEETNSVDEVDAVAKLCEAFVNRLSEDNSKEFTNIKCKENNHQQVDDIDPALNHEFDENRHEIIKKIEQVDEVEVHSGQKQFACLYCKKKFVSKSYLETYHMRIHTGENLFECPHCEKKFPQKAKLICHIRIHTREKPFECSYCGKTFSQMVHLTRHLRIHTGDKPFKCSYCEKKFKLKQQWNRHLKTHTGEKRFECSYCKAKFAMKGHLNNHIQIHTGEKPFECSQCQKRFARKEHLKRHIQTHTGEKPFECSNCKKKFASNEQLKRHIKIHTGEKPFECSYCLREFALNSVLQKHINIHTGQNLFDCSRCERKFVRKDDLKRHARTHTGEKPFDCSYCDKKFSRKDHLANHVKKHQRKSAVNCFAAK